MNEFIHLLSDLSVWYSVLVGSPAAELHCKVLGWLEGTFFQSRCASSNILFVIGCEADLSRFLSCWHSDSLWLAAGTEWHPPPPMPLTSPWLSQAMFCIHKVRYIVNICTHSQAHTQTKWITVVLCWPLFSALLVCKCGIEFIEQRGQTAALLLFSHLTNSIIW